jgi:hypothetical protein
MGLTEILSAFGLSAAAGLNAYIPLLMIGLLGRFTNFVKLQAPFDVLTNEWVIGMLVVLLVIEMFADKIPVVDHINDFINTFIRPAAGAVLFAAEANVLREVNPIIPIIAGLIVAGAVHVTKATARPVINATTFGVATPVVSFIEDVISFFAALLAIFVPFVMLAFFFVFLFIAYKIFTRRSRTRAA